MSVNFLQDIEDFHGKFSLAYDGKPRLLPDELAGFRFKFMQEELDEWMENHNAQPEVLCPTGITELLENQLDAMVDLAYVLFGTVYLQGLGPKFEEAWRRVHAANMAKVRTERAEDSKRGSTFDVIKPLGWAPPCHTDLVSDHAHQEA